MTEKIIEDENKRGLKEYIDEYHKILSVIGVFMAVGLLWRTISPKQEMPYISFLWFIATIPLLFIVWRDVINRPATLGLVLFNNLIQIIAITTAISLLFDFPEHSTKWVGSYGTVVVALLLVLIGERFFKWLFDRRYEKYLSEWENESAEKSETTNEQLADLNRKYYLSTSRYKVIEVIAGVIVIIICALLFLLPNIPETLYKSSYVEGSVPPLQLPTASPPIIP